MKSLICVQVSFIIYQIEIGEVKNDEGFINFRMWSSLRQERLSCYSYETTYGGKTLQM